MANSDRNKLETLMNETADSNTKLLPADELENVSSEADSTRSDSNEKPAVEQCSLLEEKQSRISIEHISSTEPSEKQSWNSVRQGSSNELPKKQSWNSVRQGSSNELPKKQFSKLLLSNLPAVICLLVTVHLLVYVSVIMRQQSNEPSHNQKTSSLHQMQVKYPEVCLDCHVLVKNPYAQLGEDTSLRRFTKRMEGDVMKCCAGDNIQMSAMLTAVARGQETMKDALPDLYARIGQTTSVFVHKLMVSESKTLLTDYSVVTFKTSDTETAREQSRGTAVLENGIVVLVPGIYYVYSNVFFNTHGTGRANTTQKWFSHVHRTSPQSNSRTGILLTSIHTKCYNCSVDKLSTFTGGIFQLQSGDVIRVFLSDVGLVSFNQISSYLGLIKLNRSTNN